MLYRQLSILLVVFAAGCPPGFEFSGDCQPSDAFPARGDAGPPAVLFLRPSDCASQTIVLGGGGGAPLPRLVAGPRSDVLMELAPTENCSGKTGGTLTQMVCTVPSDSIPTGFDEAGFGYRIDIFGATALPNVPANAISGSGSIDFGPTGELPTVSLTTPVTAFPMANLVPSADTPWKLSALNSPLKVRSNELQARFKVLITCGGGATLSTPFHWQVNTLTLTSLSSSSFN